MSTRRSRIARSAVIAAAIGLLAPLVGALPAEAAASCSGAGTDGTYATANCTGYGNARINVSCNAIWPFTPWTDYGSWTYVNGGLTIVNAHAYCAAPTSVWVEYS